MLAVLAGGVLGLLGLVLLLPLPEVGLPLLLGGLRLLGRRYAWARRANERVDAVAARVRARFRRLPRVLRWLVLVVVAALLVGGVVLTVQHL